MRLEQVIPHRRQISQRTGEAPSAIVDVRGAAAGEGCEDLFEPPTLRRRPRASDAFFKCQCSIQALPVSPFLAEHDQQADAATEVAAGGLDELIPRPRTLALLYCGRITMPTHSGNFSLVWRRQEFERALQGERLFGPARHDVRDGAPPSATWPDLFFSRCRDLLPEGRLGEQCFVSKTPAALKQLRGIDGQSHFCQLGRTWARCSRPSVSAGRAEAAATCRIRW